MSVDKRTPRLETPARVTSDLIRGFLVTLLMRGSSVPCGMAKGYLELRICFAKEVVSVSLAISHRRKCIYFHVRYEATDSKLVIRRANKSSIA